MNDIKLNGLRSVLHRFEEDGYCVSGKHWKIARGAYDLYFEVSYDNTPVIDCVCNELTNLCLEKNIFKRVANVILQEYNTNPWEPMTIFQ